MSLPAVTSLGIMGSIVARGGSDPRVLDCDVKAAVSGIPDPDAGRLSPEETLELLREFPEFREVPEKSVAEATAVHVAAEPGAHPKVEFLIELDGRTIGQADVEQLDELKSGFWYLTGFTVCSPVAA